MLNKLVVKNLSKAYDKKKVLKDINCVISQGEAVGLFGLNGAGKTTLFSIITGLIKADLGQLMLNDQDITNLPMYLRARLGIGYLPQESSVFSGLSVQDNIKAILELSSTTREQEINLRCDELMDEFSISHLRNKFATSLSGGERRRLEIARALAASPKFILLDEPLAGIDPIVVGDIKNLVSHLKDKEIGVLITDHNVRETLDIVDRAYIIHNGEVMIEGTADEIVNSPQVREVYLGKTFTNKKYE